MESEKPSADWWKALTGYKSFPVHPPFITSPIIKVPKGRAKLRSPIRSNFFKGANIFGEKKLPGFAWISSKSSIWSSILKEFQVLKSLDLISCRIGTKRIGEGNH
ncbi:hypothetical protein Tco_1417330 [Tanacetum coccineum]